MLVALLINLIVGILGVLLSWLPVVETLPTINGYDIDTAFMNGMGYLNAIETVMWPLKIVFGGFMVLMGYYIIKITLKFFFGHRTPTHN